MKAIIKRQHPLWGDFPTLFDDMFNEWSTGSVMRNNLPSVNVQENSEAYVMDLAAPGCKKENFNIEVNQNTLTISYENSSEKVENESKYTRKEFSFETFRRSFTLPNNTVDLDAIDAKYSDGILTVTIPKLGASKIKSTRTIEIG